MSRRPTTLIDILNRLSEIKQYTLNISDLLARTNSYVQSIHSHTASIQSISNSIKQDTDVIRINTDTIRTRFDIPTSTINNTLVDIRTILDTIRLRVDALHTAFSLRPSFIVSVVASSVAANKHHLLLFNNSGAPIRIYKILIGIEVTAAVTGFQMGFRINRISAYSGGTALTIYSLDPSDTVPTGLASVTNPTSATNEFTFLAVPVNSEETGGQHFVTIDFNPPIKPITIPNGRGITIQQYGTAGAGLVNASFIFTT